MSVVVGAFYISAGNFWPFVPAAQPSSSHAHQSVFSLITGAGGSTYGWYGVLADARLQTGALCLDKRQITV